MIGNVPPAALHSSVIYSTAFRSLSVGSAACVVSVCSVTVSPFVIIPLNASTSITAAYRIRNAIRIVADSFGFLLISAPSLRNIPLMP